MDWDIALIPGPINPDICFALDLTRPIACATFNKFPSVVNLWSNFAIYRIFVYCFECLPYAGGITSEWFCIESSLFTLFMSAGALSFYWNRTTRNARRMFHASLLYLPVFMSGLLLHRLPNSEHEFTVTDSDTHVSLSFSKSSLEVENTNHQIKPRSNPVGSQARPPVAYASVAPFPFLPAPLYVSPDP